MTTTFRAIGQRIRRQDGPERLTGTIRYTADLDLPGLAHARLKFSEYPHARIRGIDTSAALDVPGVVAVVTADDLAPLIKSPASARDRLLLAQGEVRWYGEPVVAVLAETEAAAEDALTLIDIDYEELPALVDPLAAMQPEAAAVWPEGKPGDSAEAAAHGAVGGPEHEANQPRNVSGTTHYKRGDVAQGFAEAEVVVERTYRTPWVHQGYIEPHATAAAIDPLGQLTVYTSTQGLFYAWQETHETLGLPAHQVRLVPMPVGGGFGGKTVLLEPLAAALALYAKRPVSVVYTRSDEFLSSTPAPQGQYELKLGAKRDGTLTALEGRIVMDTGLYPGSPAGLAGIAVAGYYKIPHLAVEAIEVLTHKTAQGAYRAPGAVQGTYAIESLVDELARELGRDPLDLRLQNAVQEGDPMPFNRPWPDIGLKQCIETLQQHPLWQQRDQNRRSDGHIKEGIGVAVGGWMGAVQPASAVCRVEQDGSINVMVGSVDLSGTNTAISLIAAETFGVPVEKVRIVNGDSLSAPFAGMSGGSKTTLTVGDAVVKATREAREQMLALAADRFEASPADLEIVEGDVQVKGVPDKKISIAQLAQLSTAFGGRYEPIFGRGNGAITKRAPGFAAHLAKVRVDTETGEVRVVAYVAVQDVGRAVSPAEIEGQIQGGVTQGIGWALYEQMVFDEDGRLVTGSLMDYALPSSIQVPPIEPIIIEVPSKAGPYGVRGVGEPPVVPAPAAVANAVADALGGKHLGQIPMTPERVRAVLNGEGA